MLFWRVNAAPPAWFHIVASLSWMLLVTFEKECGESLFILVLKRSAASSFDSTRLISAYNAIPAWLSLKAFDVLSDLWSKKVSFCGPMFWKVMRVQFFPGDGG